MRALFGSNEPRNGDRNEQAEKDSKDRARVPRDQARNGDANYIYTGSNDVSMINMRREAAAQGLTNVEVWACSLACYTDKFQEAGADVEGTYVWMQFIPFEEHQLIMARGDEYRSYIAQTPYRLFQGIW